MLTDRDDVAIVNERATAFQVREYVTAPGHRSEILSRSRADGVGVARMPKVTVSIDEDQPVASATS